MVSYSISTCLIEQRNSYFILIEKQDIEKIGKTLMMKSEVLQ